MKVFAEIYKDGRARMRTMVRSDTEDKKRALLECFEQVYKQFDLSEPVWVRKHELDIARYKRVKFFPDDFLEPVDFDRLEMEIISDESY